MTVGGSDIAGFPVSYRRIIYAEKACKLFLLQAFVNSAPADYVCQGLEFGGVAGIQLATAESQGEHIAWKAA